MAKKSAKTKGYRHYQEDKKAAEDKEFKTIVIGLVAFVAIVAIVMAGIKIYDGIGRIKVKDKEILNVEDNWIIHNTGNQAYPAVYKMAEMEPVEGYTVTLPERTVQYIQSNRYITEDESRPVKEYYVTVASGKYDEVPYETYERVTSIGTTINCSEIQKAEIAGMKCVYYTRQSSYDYSENQDSSDVRYSESLTAYFESKFKDYSIMVSIGGEVADENSFNSDEDLMALLEEVAGNIKMCSRFEK